MLKPLGNRCVVLPVKGIHESEQGILTDDNSVQAPQSLRVKIVNIGSEVKNVKIGQEVLVSQYGPTEAKEHPLDKSLVIPEEDILCIVLPDKANK